LLGRKKPNLRKKAIGFQKMTFLSAVVKIIHVVFLILSTKHRMVSCMPLKLKQAMLSYLKTKRKYIRK